LGAIHQKKAISNNGLFRPVIVVNGQVTGIWRRTHQKANLLVEVQFFKSPARSLNTTVKKAAQAFGDFLGQPVDLVQSVIV
jgi:hypothetical protein